MIDKLQKSKSYDSDSNDYEFLPERYDDIIEERRNPPIEISDINGLISIKGENDREEFPVKMYKQSDRNMESKTTSQNNLLSSNASASTHNIDDILNKNEEIKFDQPRLMKKSKSERKTTNNSIDMLSTDFKKRKSSVEKGKDTMGTITENPSEENKSSIGNSTCLQISQSSSPAIPISKTPDIFKNIYNVEEHKVSGANRQYAGSASNILIKPKPMRPSQKSNQNVTNKTPKKSDSDEEDENNYKLEKR